MTKRLKTDNPGQRRLLRLVTGATMISFSAVFVKLVNVGPTATGVYRMVFGSALLILIAAWRRIPLWIGWPPFLLGVAAGALFAGDLTVWHRSILAVGPGLATVLGNFQVFFLAAFGIVILRERPGWRLMAAIPLAMLGLFLIVGPTWQEASPDYRTGIILGLATAAFYASYVLVLRKLQSRPDSPEPLANIAISTITTAAVMGIIAIFQQESFAIADTQSLLILALYGLCAQVLGWVLIMGSVKYLPASRVGLILLLQPTLASIWDVVFFKRPTSGVEVVGALIALTAIYLGNPAQRSESL
jgi:drug/metabolite transporter (DMT)-like permease